MNTRTCATEDWPALAGILERCFNVPIDKWELFRDRIGIANFRVIENSGRLVGGLGVYRVGQCFGGRAVTMGGLAAVGVAPEDRGHGIAARLVADSLRWLREEGTPISSLYASTQTLYRSVGYEHAGNRLQYSLPLGAIGMREHDLEVVSCGQSEIEGLYRPANGNLVRDAALWDRLLKPAGGAAFAVRVGDEGYAVWHLDRAENHYHCTVRDWAAHTAAAGRRLWTFFADQRSIGKDLRWYGPASDPMILLTPEHGWTVLRFDRWMLRILDVGAALTARGWAMDGEVGLEIHDVGIPENAGRWWLRVKDGAAEVSRGGPGELRLDIRGLAPLYSGLHDAHTLQRMGWLEGDSKCAQGLFALPEPWMPEMF